MPTNRKTNVREHPYAYTPSPVFFGQGTSFLGIELEVVAPSYQAKSDGLRQAGEPRWCYAKSDASIGSYGTEIVTHPISVNFWMSSRDISEYRDYHVLIPGEILRGCYKGVEYITTVHEDGRRFIYNGVVYKNITQVGRAIGIKSNGYVFFGLKGSERDQVNPVGDFFRLVESLKRLGYTSHDDGRCGFHIHISRTAFSPEGDLRNPMFYKFKCLINGLLFRKLSQRVTFEYCQQETVDPHQFHERNWNRRMAVNITEKTVEVRLFRGNLREKRIRKNIEAVIAALEFSREITSLDRPFDNLFTPYIYARSHKFPNLVEYISELEACESRAPAPIVAPQDDEVIDLIEEGGS